MQAKASNFRDIIEGTKQFLVPLFQRTYCWDEKNITELWQDISDLYQMEPGPKREHFIGSFVTMPDTATPEGVTRFILIDGQQRMTTLLLLLTAVRDEARKRGDESLAQEIQALYLTNAFRQGELSHKLLPTQADRTAFFSAVHGGEDGATGGPLREAYRLARTFVAGKDDDGKPFEPRRLKEIITSSLSLVSIVLDKDDNPYVIFQSLNGTGADLTQADLIRNYFFMRLPFDRQQTVYDAVWLPMQQALSPEAMGAKGQLNHFFRHYLSKDGVMANLNTLYDELRARADQVYKSSEELEGYLHDIARHADFYQTILNPDREPASGVRKCLLRLKRWEVTVAYPLILNLCHDYARGWVTSHELAEMLDDVESFVVRRYFCRIPTNRLNKIFVSAYRAINIESHTTGSQRLVALRDYLKSQDWPDDGWFASELPRYPIYPETARCKMILELLEAAEGHKETVPTADLQVEHVMPQTLTPEWREALGTDHLDIHDRWVHTIGNLTLTAYNGQLSNTSFVTKQQIYAKSHVGLNHYLADRPKWDEEEIRRRGDLLAQKALQIRPRPAYHAG